MKRETDQIQIKDLLVRGIVGVNYLERNRPQDILINLTLYANLKKCGQTDSIKNTVNYQTIVEQVTTLVERAKRFTLEALAEDIAVECLQDSKVLKVQISVEKPGALEAARSVGVGIVRER